MVILLEKFLDMDMKILDVATKQPVFLTTDSTLWDFVKTILKKRKRKIPVADKRGNIKGIFTSTDFLRIFVDGEEYRRISNKQPARLKDVMRRVSVMGGDMWVRKAVEVFRVGRHTSYPVTPKKGESMLVGFVSVWDFVKRVRRKTGLVVKDVMIRKPIVVKKDTSVFDVTKTICRTSLRRLPVVEKGVVVGIITSYDLIRWLVKKRFDDEAFHEETIESVMRKDVISADPEEDIFDVVKKMRTHGVGGLPVVEDVELVGIITEKDVFEAVTWEKD